jgi:hypothetical protein
MKILLSMMIFVLCVVSSAYAVEMTETERVMSEMSLCSVSICYRAASEDKSFEFALSQIDEAVGNHPFKKLCYEACKIGYKNFLKGIGYEETLEDLFQVILKLVGEKENV